jgi:hypothetical protein
MEFGMNVLEIGHCEISCLTSVSVLFRPICANFTLTTSHPIIQYVGFFQVGFFEAHPKSCEGLLGTEREKSDRNLQ